MSGPLLPRWGEEPPDPHAFTARFDRAYARTARLYAVGLRVAPFWRRWLSATVPHLRGHRILEVSVGTGWLLTRYPDHYEVHGIDLNAAMIDQARSRTRLSRMRVPLCRADVAALPYHQSCFDTIVSTMAFSGYPDGAAAMDELTRVLTPRGRIVIVDVAVPDDRNPIGTTMARAWQRTGDILRDLPVILGSYGFQVTDRPIGGRGSIHLYVADREAA